MLKIKYEKQFKKDYKRIIKRGYKNSDFKKVISYLVNNETLPRVYQDHELKGEYKGFRECHIKSDWLLIYYINKEELVLYLTRTGTHSDIFN